MACDGLHWNQDATQLDIQIEKEYSEDGQPFSIGDVLFTFLFYKNILLSTTILFGANEFCGNRISGTSKNLRRRRGFHSVVEIYLSKTLLFHWNPLHINLSSPNTFGRPSRILSHSPIQNLWVRDHLQKSFGLILRYGNWVEIQITGKKANPKSICCVFLLIPQTNSPLWLCYKGK